MAEMGFAKTAIRDMGDELMGAHDQISSQSASAAKKTSAAQKAVGALCHEGCSNSSGTTAFQPYHAGARRVGEGRWRSTHIVGHEARCVQ